VKGRKSDLGGAGKSIFLSCGLPSSQPGKYRLYLVVGLILLGSIPILIVLARRHVTGLLVPQRYDLSLGLT